MNFNYRISSDGQIGNCMTLKIIKGGGIMKNKIHILPDSVVMEVRSKALHEDWIASFILSNIKN